jgi:hypothetical protein
MLQISQPHQLALTCPCSKFRPAMDRYSDEYDACRCSIIGERAALLRPDLRAWVLSASASERRNSGPRRRPAMQRRYKCKCGHRKRFRLRDARSDGAGRDVAGAGRSTDVAGRRVRVPGRRLRTRNESREPRADRSVSMTMTV